MRRRGVVGRCECECEWCSGLDELDRERDEARERDSAATGAGFADIFWCLAAASLRIAVADESTAARRASGVE
jgi:hypothetical protein